MTAVPAPAVAILVLLVVLALDAWVYTDARERLRRGSPVSVAIGSLRIETPEAWFLGCVILWVVFFPLYLAASGRNPFARQGG
ncbi:hypothetical protein [Micromonospora eburnea]|uniref:Uncharacterized protein n=1 Tax=Micromonospora eburnea TaxID=227316 RepID=A0A1C6TRI5_9ACTN|nr:hypothetical protein [Micromonospora eburnea]SCL44416.1 hypothetical protein GA0070604_0381 [Micromonospora eburnea]